MVSFSENVMLLLMWLMLSMTGFNIVAGLSSGDLKRARVEIFNDLGDGLDLTVHCKSADVDLGVHVIKYPNGFFEFDFKPNIWRTTLYFCGFRWKGSELKWFDIYDFERDHPHCSNCYWKVRPNGPCQLNYSTKKYDLCFPWNAQLPPATLP
jgi:hypothetical protein